MEESTQQPTLLSHAVRSGVILGGISIIINLIIYLIEPALMVSFWMLLLIILSIVLVVIFGIQYRNATTGYIKFGDAFKHGLYTFIISGLVATLFSLVLHMVIDPELKDYLLEVQIENAESMTRSFGGGDEQVDAAIEATRESAQDAFTAGGIFKAFGISLIIYLVLSLITGAIVKKSPPEEVV
jgi:hypothetical protein